MGRRAKKAPVQTKKRATLAKRFKCPFCANDDTVECKMDFRAGIGSLSCRLCGASYQMPIHHLHEPVDVFSEWLDDCEAAAQGRPTGGTAGTGGSGESGPPLYESDSDDDLGERSGLTGSEGTKTKTSAKASRDKNSAVKSDEGDGRATSYSELGLDDSDEDSE